ncbi:hypothetical protein PR202_gb15929 [Eleusine coracana subsp. coracana]|uniref:Uncharacterized protein n=1 Tax=Eleusine coracana subsp. coracana TaxID=191504 RepID=A0AAV5EZ65_ELECO|nr:hypothetical protein PR202_gb15929 [Eleusine coracana subsp. coracana]
MQSPLNNVGLFRAWGASHTISTDGSKLAFIDNEFKAVWVADQKGLRTVWQGRSANSVFSIAWNQSPDKDTLYVSVGPSFSATRKVDIYAIVNVSGRPIVMRLTGGGFNNAFPSSNPEGTKIVFRSTRDHTKMYKNLYIMQDADVGEFGEGIVTRLTDGEWTDIHCQWSPRGDWIVFSSTRGKPIGAPLPDHGLDFAYFSIYLVMAADPSVVVRVVTGMDPDMNANDLPGHVNHPVFNPDGRSIAFTSDLAAVSVEPISMPMFLHPGRPYGDIFSVDIDPNDIHKNKDIDKINRVTHSRYGYSTHAWTRFVPNNPNTQWNMLVTLDYATANFRPACPYTHPDGGESWHMTGHLILPRRCC